MYAERGYITERNLVSMCTAKQELSGVESSKRQKSYGGREARMAEIILILAVLIILMFVF